MDKLKFPLKHFFYVSNILSMARIILIFPFVYLLTIDSNAARATLIVLAALILLSDYFDGFLSRKLNQETELGKLLDPLADKIAMAVIFVALIIYRDFPLSLVFFLLYRDLLILVMGTIVTRRNKEIPPSNWWGKVNTFIIAFVGLFFVIEWDTFLFTILFISSYVTILLSGVSYYALGEKMFFRKRRNKYLARVLTIVLTVIVLVFSFSLDISFVSSPLPIEPQFENKDRLIRHYAPVLYFTEDEPYRPIDVRSFLEHSRLMKHSFFIPFDQDAGKGDLLLKNDSRFIVDDYYLKLDRNLFSSIEDKYTNAKSRYSPAVYANAFKVQTDEKPVYILQYWFFYWASGLGDTGISWHECDWEMVMYYLDENFEPVMAGSSRHGYGGVKKWNEIEKEEGHPVVYVAGGSHANYFSEGEFTAYIDRNKRMPALSDRCGKKNRLAPSAYSLVTLQGSEGWLNFEGYWGIPIIVRHHGPRFRNPYNEKLAMWSNPTGWFNKYR